jgi:Cu-Zn family superoxide dismutase
VKNSNLAFAAALCAMFNAGCSMPSMHASTGPHSTVIARATLLNSSGQVVGEAELRDGQPWTLAVGVSGQTAGEHGIHLHSVGSCTGPDFSSAKGHFNPEGKQHGSANPAGMHQGDIPNLLVGSDGSASASLPLARAIQPSQLFDADGTAIVLHAGPDDYRTDPAGNSGGRVACGVLRPV